MKIKCSCGYETEHRCSVHKEQPAHWMISGHWFCHECEADINSDPQFRTRNWAILAKRQLEKRFVLCPGCAYEEAIYEDAQRELEQFLAGCQLNPGG